MHMFMFFLSGIPLMILNEFDLYRLLTLGFLLKRPASLLRIHSRNIEHMASTIPSIPYEKVEVCMFFK